ncbi:cytochrome P450 [Promicromonospora sukumoe]|uniref:Cytochrome P450 n=1 Tax=Promicromonospora sukumoe TaxID=88382 RepID=A0A7W3J7D3_9MICO|nr:cytochrome P450 [Promicromonospora sukumoe]MBA8807666.1 cytochrome P450 [Promicromonospora sukumoe]
MYGTSDVRLDDLSADPVPGLPLLAAATMAPDPAAVYRTWRAQWGPVVPVELSDGVLAWLVLDYEDIKRVLTGWSTFSRDVEHWAAFHDGRVREHTGLHAFFSPRQNAFYTEGERRVRLRNVVDDGFASIDETKLVRAVRTECRRLLAQIAPLGAADLVASYTAAVPSLAVAAMYGLPAQLADRMRQYATDIFSNTAAAVPAFVGLNAMLTELIAIRRQDPGDDLLSAIVHHPRALDDVELLDTAQMIQSAGHEMSVAWTTMVLLHLLSDRDFGTRTRHGRLGIDEALDHVLVHQSPTWHTPARFITGDTELGGRVLHQGEAIVCAVAHATKTMHEGTDPIWGATSRATLAFGAGVHHCPASRVSRIITKTAVEEAMRGLHALKLELPVTDLPFVPGLWARSAATLPVTYEPGHLTIPAHQAASAEWDLVGA